MAEKELDRIRKAYEKRKTKGWNQRYSLFNKGFLQAIQERERLFLSMLANNTLATSLVGKRVLDIGCGTGETLLAMLQYGFRAENCFGVDILEDRIALARKRLPNMTFSCCSAEHIPFERGSFDLATMFLCLSSILDYSIRATVCRQAWECLKPGGAVVIYDFRVDNPFNLDVKAVTLNELKSYYPTCKFNTKTLTLLPMLGRRIGNYSVGLCNLLALCPFLRTHRMTVFQKPTAQS
jgi:ubiquinone/menaquinone biosynthesis C-methylase UbiE